MRHRNSELMIGETKHEEKHSAELKNAQKLSPGVDEDAERPFVQGLFSLSVFLLLLSNSASIFKNFVQFGTTNIQLFELDAYRWPNLTILLLLNIPVLAMAKIWILAFRKKVRGYLLLAVEGLSIGAAYAGSLVLVPLFNPNGALAVLVLVLVTSVSLKLVSFAIINHRLLAADSPGHHVSIAGMYRFLLVPWLVYNPFYKRTPSIRWSYVLSQALMFLFFCCCLVITTHQCIKPLLEASIQPALDADLLRLSMVVMELFLPYSTLFFLGFFAIFNFLLHTTAELTRHPDREFYSDWWNSTTIGEFWTRWNLPTHKFIKEHVYFPLRQLGVSRNAAVTVSFLLSAAMHEVIISTAFRTFNCIALVLLFIQVPLSFASAKLFRGSETRRFLGSLFQWFCFLCFPPTAMVYYYLRINAIL